MRPVPMTQDVAMRLLARMRLDPVSGCWEYDGARDPRDYGRIGIGDRTYLAHRVAWVWANERQIPDGLVLDHLCRNHRCIRPDHLEPVTQAENLRRADLIQHQQRDRCHRGHPRETTKSGYRVCRTCDNERTLRRYHEHRKGMS